MANKPQADDGQRFPAVPFFIRCIMFLVHMVHYVVPHVVLYPVPIDITHGVALISHMVSSGLLTWRRTGFSHWGRIDFPWSRIA